MLPRIPAAALGATCSAFALLAAVATRDAFAQAPAPAERAQVYSPYELQTIAESLEQLKARQDPKPEGKTIERIDVVPLEVFEERDPLPRWLNIFHATTRPTVVRREVLLRPGDPYNQALVDETIRNLRQLPQLSIVLVVATVGSAPGRVGLVVITKDVWSLRASWDVVITSGGLEDFELHPEERNLFGLHQAASATFLLQPSAYTVGVGYTIPRIADSRIAVVTSADVMVNRASGSPEGSFGSLVAGQPLYSGLTEWAWDASTSWQDIIQRRYVNAKLYTFSDPATQQSVPFEWRAHEYQTLFELRRSFGWATKHDFTFGVGIDQSVYRTDFPGADPQTVADFQTTAVPVSDTRVGPAIQYETYTKNYLRVIDFDTLALQEDYRLGHDIVLGLSPSIHALGSTLNLLSLTAAAQYTFAIRDGFYRIGITTLTEATPDRVAQAYYEPFMHLVTPTIGAIGRIVVDATVQYRWRNYLNIKEYLGGGDRLRGYPTDFFFGNDFVAYNAEFRSRPIEILSCQLAAVGFFDAGDAFDSWSTFEPFQSVGVGLRALFPQLDRGVFRADLGFPLERPINSANGLPIAPFAFLLSFGQALTVPSVAPTPVLPTEQVEIPDLTP
jgi:Omp85 superfamily domain